MLGQSLGDCQVSAVPSSLQMDQARHILAHLAMENPRDWWCSTPPRPDHLDLLCGLRRELFKVPSLATRVAIPALVAVAFLDNGRRRRPPFGHVCSRYSPDEYLTAAGRLLVRSQAVRGRAMIMAGMIDKTAPGR